MPVSTKRWLRRILLACSLALILAAVGLTIRGMFWDDVYFSDSFVAGNNRFCMQVSAEAMFSPLPYSGYFRPGHVLFYPHEDLQWKLLAPEMRWSSMQKSIAIPHWMFLAIGAAYPSFLWWRHRKRKKDIGFPVELSASEEHVEAAATRPY